MRTILVSLLVWLATLTAAPAQTDFDVTLMAVGQVTRWQAHNGNTSVEYLGPEGRLYHFRFERDGSKGDPAEVEFWANQRGETVKARDGSMSYRYTPHDCLLTLGRCTYVERRSDGARRKMIHVASEKGGVWTYRLYHTAETPETLIEEGTFTVDDAGVDIDRTYRYLEDGVWLDGWAKRIQP